MSLPQRLDLAIASKLTLERPHVDPSLDQSAWRWKEDELAVDPIRGHLSAMDWRTARNAMLERYHELQHIRESKLKSKAQPAA